ncbi:MAG: hypothetical protein HC842_00670 [Cytophagales bacterium]|nr:hypothetical protein [Cytophagales bacterium]
MNNIKVNGQTINAFIRGLGSAADLGKEILAAHGIKHISDTEWYPVSQYLSAYREIELEIGANTLFNIGKKIPDSAQFPPEVDNIEKGLSAIDVAFHMNHMQNGKPMFDPATGRMEEGIGHYSFQLTGDRSAQMVCDNPYPCDFDRGIITAMARKFEPLAEVELDTTKESRKSGATSSTYIIRW